MAMDKARTRARSNRRGLGRRGRARRTAMSGGRLDTSVVPRVIVGAVNGLEVVVVGALRITRDVLVRTISGVADIGAEALSAATAGVRGVVTAASRTIGDIAGATQGNLRETLSNVTHRRGTARSTLAEPSTGAADVTAAAASANVTRRPRGRARGPRAASRSTRGSMAA
jgi:hypothetical protein